jgi:hypothetical protein
MPKEMAASENSKCPRSFCENVDYRVLDEALAASTQLYCYHYYAIGERIPSKYQNLMIGAING